MSDEQAFFQHLRNVVDSMGIGDFDAALEECNKANILDPERPEVLLMLGIVAFQTEDPGRGISLVTRAHKIDPDCRDYADALGVMNAKVGNLADSLYFAKLAIVLEPHPELRSVVPEAFRDYRNALEQAAVSPHFVNASIHFQRREYDRTAELCAKELRLTPNNVPCVILMGETLLLIGKFDKARNILSMATKMEPGNASVVASLAECMFQLGRFEEGMSYCRKVLDMAPENINLITKVENLSAFLPKRGRKTFSGACRRKGRKALSAISPVAPIESNIEKIKIKIGYLSNLFNENPYDIFLIGVLKSHDKKLFDVYGYQQNTSTDFQTVQLKSACSEWRNVYDVDDDTMAYIMSGDNLDILVDLCAYSGDQRLELVAAKPAPVITSWLSWPGGAGLGVYDHVVSDPICLSGDEAEGKGEKILPLEAGLVAFDPDAADLDFSKIGPLPSLKNGFVTFGGVCDLAKLNEVVAGTWARVLDAVPNSRLFLGNVKVIPEEIKDTARNLFGVHGLGDRVSFQETPQNEMVNNTFFSQTDIVLDTFPVNGMRNTCEALLSGVPVVTLAGTGRPALMGASILRSAGREEWVATTGDAFVETAAALAGDISRLDGIRETLRGQLAQSRLCDCAAFTRDLEDVYRRMLKEGRPGKKAPGKKGPAKKRARKKK